MAVLQEVEPKEVFHFFEEICKIPHGSKNLKQISNYLVSFAQDRQYEVICDKELNVIIKAPGTKGYEDKETVILQGHMDMVAVKEDDCDIDMVNDGLRLNTDGKYVWADGTSLGGDDGIAVAYILALLDSKDIPHPPLEVIITTNEEIGMIGATALDLSMLNGKKMINIDNEEEGVFITSCAGGARVYTEFDLVRSEAVGRKCKLSVSGLLGGHSGEMIIKGRGNANHIAARFLSEAFDKAKVKLISINGGVADNAIPSNAEAEFIVDGASVAAISDSFVKTFEDIKSELEVKDPDFNMDLTIDEADSKVSAFTVEDTKRVLDAVLVMPDGVQAMSSSVEGLVETSLNLGIVKTEEGKIVLEQSVRSSVESSKMLLIKKLETIAKAFGARHTSGGQYPGWQFRQHSELRDHMVEVYKKLYGKEPRIEAIHAGLECGLLSKKIEDLDCISIGPDMQDIHSTKEKLSVSSTKNVWEYVKAVLA